MDGAPPARPMRRWAGSTDVTQEIIAHVAGIRLWRHLEDADRNAGVFVVEEPSRGRMAWTFPLEHEAAAWAKFDERALHRVTPDLS